MSQQPDLKPKPPTRRRITVMLGGPSAERDVSLRSGAAVARALRSLGHEVAELDPGQGTWSLPGRTDVVFLVLHGTYGEDGSVQEQLEAWGVPYTGCGPAASRLAFDKVLSKNRFLAAGIPTAPFHVLHSAAEPCPPGFSCPLVLKPARQGSSVGLQFVTHASEWPSALAEAFRYDSAVLLEQKIEGREATVGILAGKPLPVVEVRPHQGAYDYHNKYTPGATDYLCPAPFEARVTQRLQTLALEAFAAIEGRDYARIDIMVKADGSPMVLEVNTLPGMTETSLLPKAAAAAGVDYAQLCQQMVELALAHPRTGPASGSSHILRATHVVST